jgi:S1-C subfamily serine protease
MKRRLPLCALLLIVFTSAYCPSAKADVLKQQTNLPQEPAAGARPGESKFQLVKSVSGTKTLQEGASPVIEDPRTDFYRPHDNQGDKQVLVYFTWEGPLGPHHFEGLWKNQEGKVMVVSEFSYTNDKRRFGGYFTMLLTETIATGIWTLEVRIDGESAGTHNFQIIGAPRPDAVMHGRRPLTRGEIYQHAVAASVSIENLNDRGQLQKSGAGFLIERGQVLTAFEVLDGASQIRIIMPDGKRVEASEVMAWSRRQDWAILKLASAELPTLPTVSSGATAAWSIGDHCFSVDVPLEGNRVLMETSVVGKRDVGVGGERVIIADPLNRRAIGSPLMNEYGEVFGLIGGNPIPGAGLLQDLDLVGPPTLGDNLRGALAVPITLITQRPSGGAPTTLHELASSGQFEPPLVGFRNIMRATLARSVERKGDVAEGIDERLEYSRRDPQAVVLIGWYPKEKLKGLPSLRIYDLDNHLLSEDKAKKPINLSPGKLSYSIWQLALTGLPPGTYRIDVLLDTDAHWRAFFRIAE